VPVPPDLIVDTLAFCGGEVGLPEFDPFILTRVRESGIRLFQWGGPHPGSFRIYPQAKEEIAFFEREITALRSTFRLIRTAQDLDFLYDPLDARVAAVSGMQNPACIGDAFLLLDELFVYGVRVMQVAYWGDAGQQSPYGSGFAAREDTGLTPLGYRYLRELARVGMILDLSHAGPRTALDAANYFKGPIFFSHVGARSVFPSPRGTTDALAKLVADRHGILGVYTMTFFLDKEDNGPEPWLRHIEYFLDLVGEDAVAIGSDAPIAGFPNLDRAELAHKNLERELVREPVPGLVPRWPAYIPAFNEPDRYFVMWRLLAHRFGESIAQKIMGVNALAFYARALPE
jgi:membrane dipeptidase